MKAILRDAVLARVEKVLAPHIGARLARTAGLTQAKKLALGEHLTLTQLHDLLERLRRGLQVFVGADNATVLLAEIRRAVLEEDR